MVERRAVTLSDVAREAGVSLATASRAYNGSERKVNADLRERVLAAATRLSYAANAPAQTMARGHSNVVGLVVHDIADPYFATIAAGVMAAAETHGLLVTIASTMRRAEREVDYVIAHRGQQSRAVILAGSRVSDRGTEHRLREAIRAFEGGGGRVVAIGQQRHGLDSVVIENRSGARQLAEHLTRAGHRQFGILAGPRSLVTAQDRVAGFTAGLPSAGSGVVAVEHGDFTRDGGHAAMVRLLRAARGRLDCVFAVNDVMAVGAMAACREAGVDVPQSMGIAGFDDIVTLRDVTPSLTTVRLPLERIGELAMELVLAEPGTSPRRQNVAGQVEVRESTRSS